MQLMQTVLRQTGVANVMFVKPCPALPHTTLLQAAFCNTVTSYIAWCHYLLLPEAAPGPDSLLVTCIHVLLPAQLRTCPSPCPVQRALPAILLSCAALLCSLAQQKADLQQQLTTSQEQLRITQDMLKATEQVSCITGSVCGPFLCTVKA